MKEAKQKLQDQIRALERELTEELPLALQKALELGDLRENAEYQTAKERQSIVQAQLAQLRQRMSALSMINLKKIPTDRVSYGSTVVVMDVHTGDEATYRLVTSEESDVNNGWISTSSPIGRSLMGHQEGDEVEIRTPRGVRTVEILKLTTFHAESESEPPREP